jgi:NADH:ubiquinone oxidoreductase subunit F (NADH-binding)
MTALTGSLLDEAVVVPRLGTEVRSGAAAHDLRAHLDLHGPRPSARGADGEDLLIAVDAVGLTGRGGGHFPTARKWRSVRAAGPGGRVVVNAAEGEPACAKDAVLLQTRPHLVLDGLVSALELTGATDGVVWLHEGAEGTARSVRRAMAERDDVAGVRVVLAPDRYLSGEATAVIRALEGGPVLPRFVPDPARPWTDRPTLVANAESVARVALLARGIPAAYSSLLTVVSARHRTVVDVTGSTTVGEVLDRWWEAPTAGGVPEWLLLGGYGGSWVDPARVRHLPLDGLRDAGLSLGAGLLAPLPAGSCLLDETARLVRYLADSSAGQCGPCVLGLAAVSDLVDRLADGRLSTSGRRRLDLHRDEIAGRGACRLPDGALRMLASALELADAHGEQHGRRRRCRPEHVAVLPLPGER